MKGKQAAVMLIAALAGPASALAQDSTVEIFGYLDTSFDNVKANGATAPATNLANRNLVTSNLSMLGFRGKEDLGGGLKAVWQIVSLIPVDGPGAVNTGLLGNRDTWVGLTGGWGTARIGRGNSPFKLATIGLDPFGDAWYGGVAAYDNIIGNAHTALAGGGFPWDLVTGNMVEYVSPDFSGFSGGIMYSANEGRTTAINPYTWSAAVKYSNGPLYLTVAHERHEDALLGPVVGFAAIGTASTDKATRLGAGYTFGTTTASFVYERQQYHQNGTAITDLDHNNYMLGVKHLTGPHIFRASYLKAQSVSNLPNTGAQQWALGYGYTLSKRTELFGAWARLDNDSAAAYTPLTFVLNGLATPLGADPNMFSLGIHHNF